MVCSLWFIACPCDIAKVLAQALVERVINSIGVYWLQCGFRIYSAAASRIEFAQRLVGYERWTSTNKKTDARGIRSNFLD